MSRFRMDMAVDSSVALVACRSRVFVLRGPGTNNHEHPFRPSPFPVGPLRLRF